MNFLKKFLIVNNIKKFNYNSNNNNNNNIYIYINKNKLICINN